MDLGGWGQVPRAGDTRRSPRSPRRAGTPSEDVLTRSNATTEELRREALRVFTGAPTPKEERLNSALRNLFDRTNNDPTSLEVIEKAINEGRLNAFYLHEHAHCSSPGCTASQLTVQVNGFCVSCNFRRKEGTEEGSQDLESDPNPGTKSSTQPTRLQAAMLRKREQNNRTKTNNSTPMSMSHTLDARE